jgi:UPF0755 protein
MSHLPETRRHRRIAPKHRRRRRIFIAGLAAAVILILVIVIGANRSAIRSAFEQFTGNDYSGSGHGSVTLVIENGESGESVARSMVELDIVKNFNKVYRLIVDRNQNFYPGSFKMKLQMSAASALDLLARPETQILNRVTIKEGLRVGQVFAELSKATKVPVSDFEALLYKPADIGVPATEVSIEGWLFPATYMFAPDLTAKQILTKMSARAIQELDHYQVAVADRHNVLTLASIIQKEARHVADFYKVSRTFQNRLKINMPLQSDATVSYGSGGTTVTTTDAERADPNGYNTYVHQGLPIGPISGPGSRAIDAALHPVEGNWLYFCAINLATGETVFSTTVAEHEAAVAKFRAWIAKNPGWNG